MIKQRSPYNPHPGEFIPDELEALNWSQADLARALGVPRNRISEMRALNHGCYRLTAGSLAQYVS